MKDLDFYGFVILGEDPFALKVQKLRDSHPKSTSMLRKGRLRRITKRKVLFKLSFSV